MDLSVVNVFDLVDVGDCHYGVMDTGSAAVLENAFIVVNASLNLTESSCTALYVSVFDRAGGVFKNVSVTGEIRIILNKERLHEPVLLSGIFGTRLPALSPRSDRHDEEPNQNISSSLTYFVNGVEATNSSGKS